MVSLQRLRPTNLIVSTKWQNMHLLIERKKKLNFDDLIRPIKVSYCPFTIHLGVRQKSIPEKIARHVAVISDVNKHIYDDNLIILELSAPEDEKNTSATQVHCRQLFFFLMIKCPGPRKT